MEKMRQFIEATKGRAAPLVESKVNVGGLKPLGAGRLAPLSGASENDPRVARNLSPGPTGVKLAPLGNGQGRMLPPI